MRLIGNVNELTDDEVAVLFRDGEVPGLCRCPTWEPLTDPITYAEFPVVNMKGKKIGTIYRLPEHDTDADPN